MTDKIKPAFFIAVSIQTLYLYLSVSIRPEMTKKIRLSQVFHADFIASDEFFGNPADP